MVRKAKRKITESYIRSREYDGKTEFESLYDDLYLKITKKYKSYVFVYKNKKGNRTSKVIGRSPQMKLSEARKKVIELKELLLAKGDINPEKETFEYLFYSWFDEYKTGVNDKTANRTKKLYEIYLKSSFDGLYIGDITSDYIYSTLKKVENKKYGKKLFDMPDTYKKVIYMLDGVFIHALTLNKIDKNPLELIRKKGPKLSKNHHRGITDLYSFKEFVLAITNYDNELVKNAILLGIYTFLRSQTIREMEWKHVDLKNKVCYLPANIMKNNKPFKLPLSSQAVQVLEKMYKITGNKKYVFHSDLSKSGILSENTLNKAIKLVGFGEFTVFHGIRTTGSTFLHEMGFNTITIEKQLAHEDKNNVREAYNRADLFEIRAKMMQFWANWIDNILISDNPKFNYIEYSYNPI